MLTDIIQTITYTLDTKVLSPYNAYTDWTKDEAYRYSNIDIIDHGYIQGDVFHGAYFGEAPTPYGLTTKTWRSSDTGAAASRLIIWYSSTAACTSPSMKPKQVSSTGSAIMRAKSTPASTGTGYSKTIKTSSVS